MPPGNGFFRSAEVAQQKWLNKKERIFAAGKSETNMKKLHLGQNLLIAGLALLTLFFALLSVLAVLPAETDVEIHETVHVSSSPLSADKSPVYLISVSGVLRNTTNREITVERLTVPVDNGSFVGKQTKELMQEQIVIPAFGQISLSITGEGMVDYRYVREVTAVWDGEEHFLRNPAGTDLSAVILPVLLTVIAVFFLVRACKVRFYMAQEDRMEQTSAAGAEFRNP